MEDNYSKFAQAIKKHILESQKNLVPELVEELIKELREELVEIKRIKSAILADFQDERSESPITSADIDFLDGKNSLAVVEDSSIRRDRQVNGSGSKGRFLSRDLEEQSNAILLRTKQREARWNLDEERSMKQRLEYESEIRKFTEEQK